jgi:hypothetical protein
MNSLTSSIAYRCVSIRQGKLLRKHSLWRGGKAWRLCVEDPFETVDSHRPHDLGQVMTANGQVNK